MSAKETSKPKKITFMKDKYSKFHEWYDEILEKADIIDKRYPVKGCLIWKPYGYKALKLAMNILKKLLDETGHEEAYFPTLIPEEVFALEKDFLEGFSGETFVIERTLSKKLDRKLLLRPTSETVMYYMFKLWLTSYRDLPVKIYQHVNVFRYETKHTRPILRVREIASFIEAHTAHATREDAERQIKEAIGIYSKFFDSLYIPYIILRTPKWDTFAGAEYNYDFFTVMPDGRAIELGSVINLGQKFAKAFDIKVQMADESFQYIWQTCYGVSERVIGVLLSIHGDNKGLIFPTNIAPIQIVIIPVIFKGKEKQVVNKCKEIYEQLKKEGFRVHIDLTERGVGDKYYYWEMKGVPIRIDIGPKEVSQKAVTIARRDTGEKILVKEEELIGKLRELMEDINRNLYERAKKWLFSNIYTFTDISDKSKIPEKGIIKVPWCGKEECGLELEQLLDKEALGYNPEEATEGKCPICGEKAVTWLYLSKKY